jgi:hypothetical protein
MEPHARGRTNNTKRKKIKKIHEKFPPIQNDGDCNEEQKNESQCS